ncbi:site-specific integrase [Dethiosulfatarculus sandiegensis]|nr:site-specific integrase [Dethiosulfatarculus sandiegensis]
MRTMPPKEIQALALKYLRDVLEDDEFQRFAPIGPDVQLRTRNDGRQSHVVILNRPKFSTDTLEKRKKQLAENNTSSIEVQVRRYLKKAEIKEDELNPLSHAQLCREFLKADIKHLEIAEQRSKGNYDFEDDYFNRLKSLGYLQGERPAASQCQEVTPVNPISPGPSEPMLSEVIDDYVAEKINDGKWTVSSQQDFTPILRLFQEVIGDRPVDRINHEAVREFKRFTKESCPKNRNKLKAYRNKSVAILKTQKVPDKDRLSDKSINFYFSTVSTCLNWIKDQGYKLPDGLPRILSHQVKKLPHEQRDFFTQENLKTIFNAPLYQEDKHNKSYQFWVPLIGLYSGMRLDEISQLDLKDIRQENGVWVFDVNDKGNKHLKNPSSRRLIPIHDFLLNDLNLVGYRDYLAKLGKVKVFPELKQNGRGRFGAAVSRWFNERLLMTLGLKDEGKLSFHSFRHTFINTLKLLDTEERKVSQVVGHKKESSMTYDRYGKPYPPEIIYRDVIQMLDYGVDLSHLSRSKFVRRN